MPASIGVPAPALGQGHLYNRWGYGWGISGRLGRLFINLLGGALDDAVVAIDNGTDGIAEITKQVPAIRYLNRFRRSLTDPVRVGAGVVACDHLDAGTLS